MGAQTRRGGVSGPAGGDLGGTYPNPTVLRTFSVKSATSDIAFGMAAAPSAGQIPVALSASEVEWQTPGVVPTSGTTPDLLTLALGPQRPSGGLWFPAASTTITPAGAWPVGAVYHATATQSSNAFGVKSDSAALATNSCGLDGYGAICPVTRRDRKPWFLARFKLGPVATTCGWFVGLFKGNLVDHTTYPDYCLAFTCSSSASETTWQLGSRDGATTSKIDTLVPVTADHEYSMYFQIEGASCNDVRWAIYDHTAGVAYSGLASAKANLPALTDTLGVEVSGVNVGAISHTIYLATMPVQVGQL